MSEVRDIEEQINVYYVSGEKNMKYGTINGTLNIDSDYNEILLIENEKLVYDPNIVSKQQKEWLEELGISERGNFYLVMNEATKSKFEGQKNIGTLKEFKELINNGTFNYDIIYLVENIDLSSIDSEEPIGTESNPFNKKFDGNNYEISNINISTNGAAGLFGYVKDADIKNLTVSGAISTSEDIRAGGIVGIVVKGEKNTVIKNCINKINVTALEEGDDSQAGGIVGNTDGELIVSDCKNYGEINSYNHAGGIIARINSDTMVENCGNYGEIHSNGKNAGGVIGSIRSSKITINECVNFGTVNGFSQTGGLIGGCEGQETSVFSCFNIGDVVSSAYAGGVIGEANGSMSVKGCYNAGNITCFNGRVVGGIIGITHKNGDVEIESCFNCGVLVLNGDRLDGIGGINGQIYGGGKSEILDCYNCGVSECVGVVTQRTVRAGICGNINSNIGNEAASGNKSELKIENCYDIGKFNDNVKYCGIFGCGGENENIDVRNCYFLNSDGNSITGCPDGISGENIDISVLPNDSEGIDALVEKLNGDRDPIHWKKPSGRR